MKNIETAFRNHTHIDKIRIAKFVSQTINSTNEDINAHDGKMNTILGILAKGEMNCAGSEIKADLFSSTTESKPAMTTADIHNKPRTLTETTGSGVVRTEAEKLKAEEEEKKKREAEIEAENALRRSRLAAEIEADRIARERALRASAVSSTRERTRVFRPFVPPLLW